MHWAPLGGVAVLGWGKVRRAQNWVERLEGRSGPGGGGMAAEAVAASYTHLLCLKALHGLLRSVPVILLIGTVHRTDRDVGVLHGSGNQGDIQLLLLPRRKQWHLFCQCCAMVWSRSIGLGPQPNSSLVSIPSVFLC